MVTHAFHGKPYIKIKAVHNTNPRAFPARGQLLSKMRYRPQRVAHDDVRPPISQLLLDPFRTAGDT